MIPNWAHGPFELIESGCENQARGTDPGRRHALTNFDQSIEISIRTFGDLHPGIRGLELPRERSEQAKGNFPEKVEFLKWYSGMSGRSLAVKPEDILWFHTLRNSIYHAGNGFTPEAVHVESARVAALAVFRLLFGDAAGDTAEAHLSPGAPARTVPVKPAVRDLTAPSRKEYVRRTSTLDELLERSNNLGTSDAIREFVARAEVWGLAIRVHYYCVNLNAPANKSVGLILLSTGPERPGHVLVEAAAKSFARFYPERTIGEYQALLGPSKQWMTPAELRAFGDRVAELLGVPG